jgi:hypothetical protein
MAKMPDMQAAMMVSVMSKVPFRLHLVARAAVGRYRRQPLRIATLPTL